MVILNEKTQNQQQLIKNNYNTGAKDKQNLSNVSLNDEGNHPTITQLKALGYQVGDRVTVRCLPLDESKYAINLDGKLTANGLDLWTLRPVGDKKWKRHKHKKDGLKYLHSVNENGYGIYFNVNGGRSNAEVERVRASIFECDFGSLDDQRELIKNLGIEPTITVWSGSKSIHAYFAIAPEDSKKFEQWKQTQQVIALSTASDPALKDFTRLLRLAGFKHQKTGNVATIEINNGCQYRLSDIRSSFDSRYPYSEKRFRLYQFLTGMQASQKVDFGIDAKIVYTFAESSLDLELERYRQYKKAFTNGEHDEAQRLLKAPYSEIKQVKKNRKQQERTLDANLSQVTNNTGYNSIYHYFASHYATGFHDGGGDFWKCKCPVHEGNSNDSLHLKRDGSFIKCHSGCDSQEIYSELRDRAIKAGDKLAKSEFVEEKNQNSELTNVDITINQKYFDINIPEDKNLILLAGEKSTGKTFLMAKEAIDQPSKRPILACTHREQLSRGLASKFDIPYVDRANGERYGLVINSLHEFSKAEFTQAHLHKWDGAYLFFDEFEQMLWAVLNSKLMKNKRALIIFNLQALINHAILTGGKVFVGDADLSDISKDFLVGCCEDKSAIKKYIVRNDYKPHEEMGTNLFCFTDPNPDGLWTLLQQQLLEGKKILCHVSGQKIDKSYTTTNLESIANKRFPDKRVLRIDSETIADKNHPAFRFVSNFYHNPDILEQYDLVLASPTLETGISNDDPNQHFDSVFGIFSGLQSPNTVSQCLFRNRRNIPRYIWVNGHAHNQIGNGSTSALELIKDITNKSQKIISDLINAGYSTATEENLEYNSIFLNTWAKLAAKLNQEFGNYFKNCVYRLRRDGYQITGLGSLALLNMAKDDPEKLKKLFQVSDFGDIKLSADTVKSTKTANADSYYEKIESLPNPDDHTFDNLKNKQELTKEEREIYHRGRLERFYKVTPTKALIEADSKKDFGIKLTRYFYLTIGSEYLDAKDAKAINNLLKDHDKVLPTDIINKTKRTTLEGLKAVGIEQFLDDEAVFTNEGLSEWFNQWLGHKEEFKRLTGISLTEKSTAISTANKLLELIDCQLARHKRRGTNKEDRYWEYKLKRFRDVSWELKQEIFDQWLKDLESNVTVTQENNNIYMYKGYGDVKKQGDVSQTPDIASNRAVLFPQDAIAQAKAENNPYNQIRMLVTNPLVHTFTIEAISQALGLAQDYVGRCMGEMVDLIRDGDGLMRLEF